MQSSPAIAEVTLALLRALDDALESRAVLFGRPPPEGRDIDLIVRPSDAALASAALLDLGFRKHGHRLTRFRDCRVDVVELIEPEMWGLGEAAADALFSGGEPLEEYEHIAAPAPHHALLITARKLAVTGAAITDERRARVRALAERDASAWETAEREAPGWGAHAALEALRSSLDRSALPRSRRVAALGELARARGVGGGAALVAAGRRGLPVPRRGHVIAFSGLDGSGKSTQAEALERALQAIGFDTVTRWTSLTSHPPLLKAFTRTVKRVAGGPSPGASPAEPPASADAQSGDDPVRAIRSRSKAITWMWAFVVAIANGWSQGRAVTPSYARGKVVICDRYILDSVVNLRYRYPEIRWLKLHEAVIRLLSPKPDMSWFLDVPGEVATARRDDYSVAQNNVRAQLYRDEHERLGARRLDGCRPAQELCEEIGAAVLETVVESRPPSPFEPPQAVRAAT
ncbi:MAG TPA: hypothetical protein VD790_01125 [Thermoleophilaceae bacterium]|nr:hypothetical protein [Thermoleophilaceae bacterium]